MSKWPGKYIIGLTGNIATGKSVVRRMLEHLGAYTIDADSLSHRAISKGGPAYQLVIDKFGKWLIDKDGEIDRTKLGTLTFADGEAMKQLEDLIHPFVIQAIEVLIQRAPQPVVVIEAIKLLESSLRQSCDSIWVSDASEDVQVDRLIRKREMTRAQALERIKFQSAQNDKLRLANVIVKNSGSYEDLWKQVSDEWQKTIPSGTAETPTLIGIKATPSGDLTIARGKPKNSAEIAGLITRLSKNQQKMTSDDVMASFGDKAYLLLKAGDQIVGLAGWQVENLVARTTDLYLESSLDADKALETILTEVEKASRDLQAEASLLFPLKEMTAHEAVFKKLGYEQKPPDALGVQAWEDAAKELSTAKNALYFKQLRQDRVLRPI